MDLVGTSSMLLTTKEAAALLGVGRTKLYELIGTGRLFSLRIDGCRRVPRASVDAFIEGLTKGAPGIHRVTADADRSARPS